MNQRLLSRLASLLPANPAGLPPQILTSCSLEYEEKCQVFNTKFEFRPAAIVLVETTDQVSAVVQFANRYPSEVELRVRSGGHDHEGECSGTGILLIDFSKMNLAEITEVTAADGTLQHIVSVQPGARFRQIKPFLDANHIGIAHGTCETVAIAGFTLGGGWGPWTRAYGMGCERLIGATIVLGNGEVCVLSSEDPAGSPEAKLLWALRGGGGFSYGLVTELRFVAFELPANLCSFNLHCIEEWPNRPALEILQCWEKAIDGNQNPQLVGTNLKVVAKHLEAGEEADPNAVLECTFNGYFAGTEDEAREMVAQYFGSPNEPLQNLLVQVQRSPLFGAAGAAGAAGPQWHFDSWDRQLPRRMRRQKRQLKRQLSGAEAGAGIHEGITLEADGPAPHKITSRLVDAEGWGDEGRQALICSLQSQWVPSEADLEPDGLPNDFAINNYITLGAITGPFYATYDKAEQLGSAFPYKNRPFTIQYQVWWDQYLNPDGHPTADPSSIANAKVENRPWANRAEDWIAACRDYPIPNTSGAFISFKDSSVLTATYFAESYKDLRDIKENHSKDKYVLFRSRKTIL